MPTPLQRAELNQRLYAFGRPQGPLGLQLDETVYPVLTVGDLGIAPYRLEGSGVRCESYCVADAGAPSFVAFIHSNAIGAIGCTVIERLEIRGTIADVIQVILAGEPITGVPATPYAAGYLTDQFYSDTIPGTPAQGFRRSLLEAGGWNGLAGVTAQALVADQNIAALGNLVIELPEPIVLWGTGRQQTAATMSLIVATVANNHTIAVTAIGRQYVDVVKPFSSPGSA